MIRLYAILLALCAAVFAEETPTRDIFQAHLAIWSFELELNRQIPKKSLIEINPHTKAAIKANAHRFLVETREALAKDITLLLAIKDNDVIATLAKQRGLKVYRNSFGKDEWPEWLGLLDEMVKASKQPPSK